ncbi:ATP-binding cassette domain-containing protein [Candidatus Comchoanobacter bicostacola]|uniref:ATP-binding cassette domain-containing protein n=1 Tax=Candidatus Comchoanobacter bicostacola TaxID=2919598 RepID=A0ABY5DL68_9GAMM|nr:ATP-binding cassette domain-containing protein [Candidatus Comchoanobacter bicostacola]UTC24974.1 ATP-binding cassette domain-containing protein [Candidatus Comchoanobacter bicostacola]
MDELVRAKLLSYQVEGASPILRNINIQVLRKERVAIYGRSGAGKTSLLHCLSGLALPSSGELSLLGKNISLFSASELSMLRRETVSIAYQSPFFMPELSIYENLVLAFKVRSLHMDDQYLSDLLSAFHLCEMHLNRMPGVLSGGEKTRLSLIRALLNRPKILFADEPTAALDPESSLAVYKKLFAHSQLEDCALVVVTHDKDILSQFDRVYCLDNGILKEVR